MERKDKQGLVEEEVHNVRFFITHNMEQLTLDWPEHLKEFVLSNLPLQELRFRS